MLLNFHTHYPSGAPGLLEIENLRPGISASGRAHYFSAGLHPWFLNEAGFEADVRWLGDQAKRPDVIAIGEAGLDQAVQTPPELQLRAFERCAQAAEAVGKPLIIHCVRAYAGVTAARKSWQPRQAWVIHGFDKHPQTARMLCDAGCDLSFGKAIFKPGGHAAEALRQMPPARFFLETDDDPSLAIEDVYARAAEIRGETPEAILDQVWQHAEAIGLLNR